MQFERSLKSYPILFELSYTGIYYDWYKYERACVNLHCSIYKLQPRPSIKASINARYLYFWGLFLSIWYWVTS